MDSVIGASLDLLNADIYPLEYVLTYKMSQDHLELFFNAVRRQGMLVIKILICSKISVNS